MTYLKTAILSSAAIALAAPAFAGDYDGKKKMDDMDKPAATMTTTSSTMMTDSMTTDTIMTQTTMDIQARTDVAGAVQQAPSKANDTWGEVLQADGEPDVQSDRDIIVAGDDTVNIDVVRAADDDGMIRDNAIVVPSSVGAITTVSCPAGTTAQVDMTCLVTGNWVADLED